MKHTQKPPKGKQRKRQNSFSSLFYLFETATTAARVLEPFDAFTTAFNKEHRLLLGFRESAAVIKGRHIIIRQLSRENQVARGVCKQ